MNVEVVDDNYNYAHKILHSRYCFPHSEMYSRLVIPVTTPLKNCSPNYILWSSNFPNLVIQYILPDLGSSNRSVPVNNFL